MGAADPGLFVFKSSLRAAIVVPVAFAIANVVVDNKQMALFAAFGSLALLVFVNFGGSRRARLRAYLGLVAAGVVFISLGTLCSRSALLATVSMVLVAFAILFAGVLNDYVAAARTGAVLAFVLPVMVPADAATIPMRLAGWGVAAALSIAAVMLLWPARPRGTMLLRAAVFARTLAEVVEARFEGAAAEAGAGVRRASEQATALRDRFVAMGQRPSGTAGPTAALARLIEDLANLHRVADRTPLLARADAPCVDERAALLSGVPRALRGIAACLEGDRPRGVRAIAELRRAHDALGRAQLAYFASLASDREELAATAEVDEAYLLRQLSSGTLAAGEDGLAASDDRAAAGSSASRWTWVGASTRLARTHARFESVWLRNSVRGAIGLALAVLVGQLADLQHAFWIVLGTLSVLRSRALSTSASIAWALIGTLAGIVIGGLIVLAVGGEQAILWVVLPLAVFFAAYAQQAISFAAGQAAFSVVVLVLFNLLQPVGWRVGIVRVEDVAIGAAVSLVVGLLIWPRGANVLLRRTIGAAYASAAQYLDATITALLGEGGSVPSGELAREAVASGQLLDAAVRDYLANRNSAGGRLHDLTVLATGATRMRRVAVMLANPEALVHLEPIDGDLPRLLRERDEFDGERHALCDWYAALGAAIADGERAPDPEHGEQAGALARERSSGRAVVLEPVAVGRGLQPGVAIAWASRHIDALIEFEPKLTAAYARVSDGASTIG